jgi:hypothetical protein
VPRFAPSDLRAGRLHFLCDLTWAGTVYRLAESVLTVALDSGTYEYGDGLSFGGSWEDRLDLFASAPSGRSASVELSFPDEVDVPARIAAGAPLGAATAVLSLWLEGTTTTRTVLAGSLRGVRYGTKKESVRATIEEMPLRSPGLVPSMLQRIKLPAEVSSLAPGVHDQYYPIIFGRPGGSSGYGSPAFFHAVLVGFTSSVTIAAHPCVGGTVKIINDDTAATETAAVIVESDGNYTGPGIRRTAVDLTSLPATSGDADKPHYVQWTSGNAGGLPSAADPTVPMRGAGEILAWLMARSGARVDYGRTAAASLLLDRYKIDAAIVPGKEERVQPLEWARQHLLPILPVSMRVGDDGLYPVVWRFDATEADAVATISADEQQASRVGEVEYSDPDALHQAIRLDYALDYREDTYQSSLIYTGDTIAAGTDSTIVLDPDLRRSFLMYAGGDTERISTFGTSSDAVLETATAHLVCRYLARRHGRQTRLVRYEADPEFAWLEPGAVVLLTDSEVALSRVVATVETVVWSSDERVGLGLRIL